MANATDGVRSLVADVLRSLPHPYSDDITDEVCRAIETDPVLRRRYDELAVELKDWVVNNWIGRYTAELTGRRSGEARSWRGAAWSGWYCRRRLRLDGGSQAVSTVDFEPLTIGVPLREDPPGVFLVGDSRVLLELVLDAFKRGESTRRSSGPIARWGSPTCTQSSAGISRTRPHSTNISVDAMRMPPRFDERWMRLA